MPATAMRSRAFDDEQQDEFHDIEDNEFRDGFYLRESIHLSTRRLVQTPIRMSRLRMLKSITAQLLLENLLEPQNRQASFQGIGRRLASSSSVPIISEPCASVPISTAPTPSTSVPELPSTLLQVRLTDVTRIVANFNFHQTVVDIRAFIDASRPSDTKDYQL
ncbi:plant UBX domain-containing protein 5-like [Lycium ferocissimum]|uniref:plant UBX domain-containing protein 5-like n=1 Tax=Lycium ferocissimum TaxID=112874 RepID=UPI0028162E9F|nr:plant UBX domain-containing protein 5-like [Lycium ferocissimum]